MNQPLLPSKVNDIPIRVSLLHVGHARGSMGKRMLNSLSLSSFFFLSLGSSCFFSLSFVLSFSLFFLGAMQIDLFAVSSRFSSLPFNVSNPCFSSHEHRVAFCASNNSFCAPCWPALRALQLDLFAMGYRLANRSS